MSAPTDQQNQPADRRTFFKRSLAAGLGMAALAAPVGAAVSALLDPLGRRSGAADFLRITSLGALPEDGQPRRFPVFAARQDGWARFAQEAVGAVYLRRTGANTVEALNVICPHAGCHVTYRAEKEAYHCPCHDSWFTVAGAVRGPRSPSPRAMDTLAVEVRGDGEVWVRFQNFRTGTPEKVPLA